jgi:hypothetical protein
VIAAARDFVCAADEVWRLQRGSDADCVFFQRMVNGGARIVDRGSRQGLWVCAPGDPHGEVLAYTGARDADAVLATLAEGLAAWRALPPEHRRLPADVELEPRHRWEHNYPEGGLVLERVARDLSPAGLDAAPSDRWNRDFAWFTAAEVRSLVPPDAAPGDTVELPLVARRLARFCLVDNVRGQTIPYAEGELREARLEARVTARDGDRVTLELEGETEAVADGPWRLGEGSWKPFEEHPHGLRANLIGRAALDLGTGRFTAFDLVALGRFHGRTTHNARPGADAEGLVGFHLGLATGARVAPTFLSLYDADWVVHPTVPTWRAAPAECGLEEDRPGERGTPARRSG